MTIINTSPDRPIQLGYEGEDRVTVLRFRYGAEWLENREGIFRIRVRRHGENHAYNAQLVTVDLTHMELLMTVTDVELSVKGSGEMQVVYSGENFVKKSPIYSYNVSRAVDEAVDPPAQDVYTQIIESLSDLQTDVQGKADVQTVSALADEITDLNSDVQGLQTIVQGKADTQTVTALSDTVSGLQTAMQGKADVQTVTALSGTVSSLSDTTQQYMEYTNSAITDLQDNKASKSYVDGELATKANVQTVTALSGTVTDLQANKADKTYVDTELAGKASTAVATTSTNGLMSAQDKSKLDEVGLLKEQIYNSYPNVEAETASVVSITDGADGIPVKSLIVGIEPAQDLHGYDSPWPAGGGANRWDEVWEVGGIDSIGNNSPDSATIRSKNYIAVSSETSYYYYNGDGITAGLRFYDSNKEYIGNAAGTANRSFTTPSGTAYMRFVVLADYGTTYKNNIAINYPSTTTTYFPYSNICPISGWTGCNISRTGKNLFPQKTATLGKPGVRTATVYFAEPIKPGSYIFSYEKSGTYTGTSFGIQCFNGSTNVGTVNNNTGRLTISKEAERMYFYFPQSAYDNDETLIFDNIQLELADTATSYEPYQGGTYDITFPSEAGTVYGGTLDVTNGTLTVDRAMADLGTLTWIYDNKRTRFESADLGSLAKPAPKNNTLFNGICSSYTAVAASSVQATNGTIGLTNIAWLLVHDDRYDNATAFKTAMSGVQLVYELAAPITYQLTPQEVETLLGVNNLWADTGDTSLAYRADTKLYVDGICADYNSMLAPVESTYIATRNYTMGELLIVDNTLYKVTANIANGGTITAGTNVVSTTLSEVIASLS